MTSPLTLAKNLVKLPNFWLSILLLSSLIFLYHLKGEVTLSNPTILSNHKEIGFEKLPLNQIPSPKFSKVSFILKLKGQAPDYFSFILDDRVNNLKINDKLIDKELRTGKYALPIQEGINSISFTLINDEGRLYFDIIPFYKLKNIVKCLSLFLFLILLYSLIKKQLSDTSRIYSSFFITGLVFRYAYYLINSYFEKSYDYTEHIEYINFITNNGFLPEPAQGWQFYQMPAYYLLASFVSSYSFQVSTTLKLLSLNLSVISLGVMLLIGAFLKLSKRAAFIFAMIVSFSPTAIYLTTRISNDSLVFLLVLAFLLFTVKFLTSNKSVYCFLSLAFAILASLTKLSGLICFPLSLLAFLFKRSDFKKSKALLLLFSLAVSISPAALLNYSRNSSNIISSTTSGMLNPGLSVSKFNLSFNPKEIIKNPQASSWNANGRSEYFLEYLYKSYFTGEFEYSKHKLLNQAVLGLSFFLVPFLIFGFYLTFRNTNYLIIGSGFFVIITVCTYKA